MGYISKLLEKPTDDRKYANAYDEYHRSYTCSYAGTLNFNVETIFKIILKTSIRSFKGGYLLKPDVIKLHSKFKTNNGNKTFEVTAFVPNKIYQLKTVRDEVIYFTTFKVSSHHRGERTTLRYEQSVTHDRTIGGFTGQIAKYDFRRKTKTHGKEFIRLISGLAQKECIKLGSTDSN